MTGTTTRGVGNGHEMTQSSVSACQNVGETERWVSAIGGGLLTLFGLSRRSLGGVALAAAGSGLLYRGLSGHCHMYQALGLSTAEKHGPSASVKAGHGCKVEHEIYIDRPSGEIYSFWREFDNLPIVMSHLESVTVNGDRSHWVAKGPAGITVEWDADIINERPNELIAWRSIPGGDVDTAGSVHFEPVPGRGTRVTVVLKYDPPAGKAGAAIAGFFRRDAQTEIENDLDRFKEAMESGNVTPVAGHSQRFSWPDR